MRKVLLLMVIFGVMLLVACSNDNGQASSNTQVEVNEEEKKMEEPANIYPFTGIKTDEEVNHRMVGIMVNNHPTARPQTGLSKADIVFEILSEGDITRLLALYQSEEPDVVGPVRSAREYYFNLANDYGALYIYHGAAEFIDDMIKNRGIDHLNGAIYDNDGHLFKRESFRKAPHNSYLQFTAVDEVAESNEYDITRTYEALPFMDEDDAVEGENINNVEIVYSNSAYSKVMYEYDDANEVFIRYNGDEMTVELDTEQPIELDNVFIVETNHKVIDNSGRREIDLESGGNAYLLQKGKIQNVQWENQDGRIVPVKDGQAVKFVPGKSWVNVVPADPGLDSSVTVSSGESG